MTQLQTMRDLSVVAVGELKARKVSDVEVIATSAIDADSLSAFITGFDLSNYEWSQRGELEDEKNDEKDIDQRIKRRSGKALDSFNFSHEQDLTQNQSCAYNVITTEATKFARDLANTRASHANPAWMEKQIRDMVTKQNCALVKEVRTLASKELKEQGMDLLYAVGQSA